MLVRNSINSNRQAAFATSSSISSGFAILPGFSVFAIMTVVTISSFLTVFAGAGVFLVIAGRAFGEGLAFV